MKTFYKIHDANLDGIPVYINSAHIVSIIKWGDNCIIKTVDGNSYKTLELFSKIIAMLC